MKKGFILTALLLLLVFAAAGCAAGPNPTANTTNEEGKTAGFWLGLWHGFITPFTFIISLFNKNINIYEVVNNGGWYNFGYVVGLSMIFGGGGGGAARRRKSKE